MHALPQTPPGMHAHNVTEFCPEDTTASGLRHVIHLCVLVQLAHHTHDMHALPQTPPPATSACHTHRRCPGACWRPPCS